MSVMWYKSFYWHESEQRPSCAFTWKSKVSDVLISIYGLSMSSIVLIVTRTWEWPIDWTGNRDDSIISALKARTRR